MIEKTKVIGGIHVGAFPDLAITIEKNGIRSEVPWGDNPIIKPEYVDALLDDMGVGKEREAVKNYCLSLLTENGCVDHDYRQDELSLIILGFIAGYEAHP